jgi:hypothetical protein
VDILILNSLLRLVVELSYDKNKGPLGLSLEICVCDSAISSLKAQIFLPQVDLGRNFQS